jgi:hypothetical protein
MQVLGQTGETATRAAAMARVAKRTSMNLLEASCSDGKAAAWGENPQESEDFDLSPIFGIPSQYFDKV